jgi:hypothetical protein
VVDHFHTNQLEFAAVNELGRLGVASRAAKSRVIFEDPVLLTARAKDDDRLLFHHQARPRQRRPFHAQAITEF